MIKKCIMCGKEFEARGRQATCSATCSRSRLRLRQLTNLRAARYREHARQRAMGSVVLAFMADYMEHGIIYVLKHYKLKYNTSMIDDTDDNQYYKTSKIKQGTRHERD